MNINKPASREASTVSVDVERYIDHLSHLDISHDRKRELIGTVGQIMRSFVDRAFGDDAAQLVRKDGDEIQIAREARFQPVVSSEHHNKPGESALTRAFEGRAVRERRKEKR